MSGKLCEMYHLYVNEMSKLVRLLLMLASRLARADNALVSMKHDCSNYKVIVHTSLQFLPFFSMVSGNMGDLVALSVGRRTCDCGFESLPGTVEQWPWASYLHLCASVTKQYNLTLVKGQ